MVMIRREWTRELVYLPEGGDQSKTRRIYRIVRQGSWQNGLIDYGCKKVTMVEER
jgi:hypothetical protein